MSSVYGANREFRNGNGSSETKAREGHPSVCGESASRKKRPCLFPFDSKAEEWIAN